MTHHIQLDDERTVQVEDLDGLITHLTDQFGEQGLSTRRSVDEVEVSEAFKLTGDAKKRVRVYSSAGFVPNSYRYHCDIQYVEAQRCGEQDWLWHLGWDRAQRKNARASRKVVR